jgi:hypothetical protein
VFEAGAIVSDDEAGAIAEDVVGAAAEDEVAGASAEDEVGAAAEDELTATALDEEVTTVVVGVPRLKIQMRPMITITTTMMIIQVLRFMGKTLC